MSASLVGSEMCIRDSHFGYLSRPSTCQGLFAAGHGIYRGAQCGNLVHRILGKAGLLRLSTCNILASELLQ
eukprot:4574014-Alexandrium_andersonii.AAC.1